MKKLVSVLFAALLVGSFAFAEVTVGSWNRLLFSPMADIDSDGLEQDTFAFMGPDWGDRGRVGLGFSASGDNTGFVLDIHSNGTKLGVGDQAKGWITVNEMLKINMGQIQGDVLRGKVGGSGFLGAISGWDTGAVDADGNAVKLAMAQGTTGEDDIFARFYPKAGMLLEVTPAEGIYLGLALDTSKTTYVLTEDMYKLIQIGGGYVIADVGHLRAQYIGGADDMAKYFQAAFAYTAMEGVLVDAGLKYQMESKAGKSHFAVGATYGKDALSAVARAKIGFGENGDDDELLYQVSADVGYVVSDPLGIGAEVSYKKEGDPSSFTVAPYAKLGYAGGFLKAAFAYTSFTDFSNADLGPEAFDYTAWSIPIMMQFGF